MNSSTVVFPSSTARMQLPGLRRISSAHPFGWLRAGASDLAHAWPLSLAYGAAFAVLGYLLTHTWGAPHVTMALMSGFLFVAPILATMFYFISHLREHRHQLPNALLPLLSWRHNPVSLGLFALMLVFVLTVWERVSAILVALFLNGSGLSAAELLSPAMLNHPDFLLAYTAFGGTLALMVFSVSVVSLPMLLHRKVDFATALVTSFMATRFNLAPLMLWAAIIASLILVGFLTNFIAMAIVFPLLGHASWHAYRDLIEADIPTNVA